MLFVGMNEEIWMRALILNALMRKYGDTYPQIWKSLIISALIFGAIYIKSKNIWAGITIHALVDWCSLFIGNCFMGTKSIISMEMTIQQAIIIIALGSLPPILIAWLLLRNKNVGVKKIIGVRHQ